MKRSKAKLFCVFYPVVLGFISPSVIKLFVQMKVGHQTFIQAFKDIMSKQFETGQNLFLVSLLGLLPFIVLATILFVYVKTHNLRSSWCWTLCGKLGTYSVMIPAHIAVWAPMYSKGLILPTGLTSYLFIPLASTASMLVGLLLARRLTQLPWFIHES